MTTSQRRTRRDAAVVRFLLEDFVNLQDEQADTNADEVRGLQTRAARMLLPGPSKGAFSSQQLAFTTLSLPEFRSLRLEVRNWLRAVVTHGPIGTARRLRGALTVSIASIPGRRDESARKAGLTGLLFEMPDARELFWLYLLLTIGRIGVEQIAVCHAPRSRREAPEDGSKDCGRLFLRRGRAKHFCSDRCRARVATQRARNPEAQRRTR
jgi:hypothetical protein